VRFFIISVIQDRLYLQQARGSSKQYHAVLHIVRVVKSRKMRWVGYVAPMGEMRNLYETLVGNLEGKRQVGSIRHRW